MQLFSKILHSYYTQYYYSHARKKTNRLTHGYVISFSNLYVTRTKKVRKCSRKKCMKCRRSAFFWVVKQRVVVVPYRRFGTTCLSHLRVSRNPKIVSVWDLVGCPETSVRNCQYTLCSNSEERRFYLHHDGSVKSSVSFFITVNQ